MHTVDALLRLKWVQAPGTAPTCLIVPCLVARSQLYGKPSGNVAPSLVVVPHEVWAPIQPTGLPQTPGIAEPVTEVPSFERSS